MSRNRFPAAGLFWGVLLASFLQVSCSSRSVTRQDIENAHGLKLPPTVRNPQQKTTGGLTDRGVLSVFETDTTGVNEFVAQLKVKSRNQPSKAGAADPLQLGWSVWPQNSQTFVPGNKQLEGLQKTWPGTARPIEMLSCNSPKGDWLHVEIWEYDGGRVVKLYTDWN